MTRPVPRFGSSRAAIASRAIFLGGGVLLVSLAVMLTAGAHAQQTQQTPGSPKAAKTSHKKSAAAAKPALEPKAIDILKAACSRLAAAHSMEFTAIVM